MKDPVKRLKGTIAVAIVFLIVYTAVMFNIEQHHYNELIMADSVNKTESVRGMIEGYGKTADEVGSGFCEDENARVRLAAIRLQPQIADGEFTGERFGGNSMVVRVSNGKVELPPEAAGLFPVLTAEMVTSEYEQTGTEIAGDSGSDTDGAQNQVLLTSGRIGGDWYFVRWTSVEEYDAYIRSHLSADTLAETVESVNDIELFIIRSDPDSAGEEGSAILHKTKGLSKYSTLDELGITREDLDTEKFSLRTENGKEYICFPIEIENLGYTAVCCNAVEGERLAILGDVIAQVLFAAVMLAGLITWCYSVQWLVRRESLDEKQKEKYSPQAVRRRTTRLTVMSTLVVTLFAFTTVMVQYMYQENRIGRNVLSTLQTQIEDGKNTNQSLREMDAERFTALGEIVSDMLTENPALLGKERLAEIAGAISAEYLILYDENGAEAACSKEYVGFSLPSEQSDSFYDFRRLLKGVPVIVHSSEKDMITGDIRSFVGIRYDIPGKDDAFGALLIALPTADHAETEEEAEEIAEQVKQQVYRRMQSGERMIMEVDPESHKVLSCSRKEYTGTDIESLGMDPKGLTNRSMNFYTADGDWYFGITGAVRDNVFFCLTDSTDMSRTGLLLALLSGGLFLIGCVITAKYGLKEYTEENYEHYAPQMMEASEEYMKKIAQRAPSMSPLAVSWSKMLPEIKTKAILQMLTGILLVVMILVSFGNSPFARHSVLSFVVRGNWTKGINLFSVIAVIVTFCVEYLAYLVVKVVSIMLISSTDLKGETVFTLVRSFINYAMFIGAVCVSLNFLGVDTATLLASIGLLSLAISLGAKDIVADILAGLSIVFEGTYFVGDYVRIGDFKGKVLEIGIRSTKISGGDKDVKIISNHEIGSVINYSKQTSVCAVKIGVPVTVSVEEMKKLFDEELPLVREINPYIIKGPKFEGIDEFIDDRMIICISAEGPEEHITSIRRDLNQVLQSMAERELLQYAQSNITINLEGASVKREESSGLYGKLSNAGDPDQKSEETTGESSPSPEETKDRSLFHSRERNRRVIRGSKKDKQNKSEDDE